MANIILSEAEVKIVLDAVIYYMEVERSGPLEFVKEIQSLACQIADHTFDDYVRQIERLDS